MALVLSSTNTAFWEEREEVEFDLSSVPGLVADSLSEP